MMRRYGGDMGKARRVLYICGALILIFLIPVLWLIQAEHVPGNVFSMPYLWGYGLILMPVVFAFLVNLAWRKFDRIAR